MKEKASNYLTSKEVKSSIRKGHKKSELIRCFDISETQLQKLISGKISKIKIPRTSMWYEEQGYITELRNAVKDFIRSEKTSKKQVRIDAIKIIDESIDDLDKKRKRYN